MSKIPPQRIAASCNVFYLIVVYHGGLICGKDSKAWGMLTNEVRKSREAGGHGACGIGYWYIAATRRLRVVLRIGFDYVIVTNY